MPFAQRPDVSPPGGVPRSVRVACEPLERRMLLSTTSVDAVDGTSVTTDSAVDAAATSEVKTNNGTDHPDGWHVHNDGKVHFHGKFRWV